MKPDEYFTKLYNAKFVLVLHAMYSKFRNEDYDHVNATYDLLTNKEFNDCLDILIDEILDEYVKEKGGSN